MQFNLLIGNTVLVYDFHIWIIFLKSICCLRHHNKLGSRADLEFKTGLETAFNYKVLSKSLNSFQKWEDGLMEFGI